MAKTVETVRRDNLDKMEQTANLAKMVKKELKDQSVPPEQMGKMGRLDKVITNIFTHLVSILSLKCSK